MKRIFCLFLAIFMVVSSFPRNCSASLPLDSEIEITNVDSDIPLVIIVSQRPSSYFIDKIKSLFCIEKIKSSNPNNQEYIVGKGDVRLRLRFTDTSPRTVPNPILHQEGGIVIYFDDFEIATSTFYGGPISFYRLIYNLLLDVQRHSDTMTESEELQSSNIALVNDINSNSPTPLPGDHSYEEESTESDDFSSVTESSTQTPTTPLPDDHTITIIPGLIIRDSEDRDIRTIPCSVM